MAGAKKESAAAQSGLKSIEPEPSSTDEPKSTGAATNTKTKDSGAAAEATAKPPAATDGTPATSADKDSSQDSQEAPPQRPQRPSRPERRASLFTSNLSELKTAFPDSSADVCRGMLVAASNNLENAFSGMLAISDSTIRPAAYVREQIAHDEQLARNLAMSDQRRRRSVASRRSRMREYDERQAPPHNYEDEEPYDGLQKSFTETKQVVSSFWGSLKERISGELHDDDEDDALTSREPLKSQWFPRQPSGAGQRSQQPPGPRLPPRKPSRPSSGPALDPATTKAAAATEPRSVNAFGDDSMRATDAADEQEPDAFFIGESDDDLGSLNDEAHARSHSVTDLAKSNAEATKGSGKPSNGDAKDQEAFSSESNPGQAKAGAAIQTGKAAKADSTTPTEGATKADDSKSEDTKGAADATKEKAAAGSESKEDAPSAKNILSKYKSSEKTS